MLREHDRSLAEVARGAAHPGRSRPPQLCSEREHERRSLEKAAPQRRAARGPSGADDRGARRGRASRSTGRLVLAARRRGPGCAGAPAHGRSAKGGSPRAAIVLGTACRPDPRVHLVASVSPELVAARPARRADREGRRGDRGWRRRRPRHARPGRRARPAEASRGARRLARAASRRRSAVALQPRSDRAKRTSLMRVLALDFGSARCGCAISDPTGTIATPIEAIPRPARRRAWRRSSPRERAGGRARARRLAAVPARR